MQPNPIVVHDVDTAQWFRLVQLVAVQTKFNKGHVPSVFRELLREATSQKGKWKPKQRARVIFRKLQCDIRGEKSMNPKIIQKSISLVANAVKNSVESPTDRQFSEFDFVSQVCDSLNEVLRVGALKELHGELRHNILKLLKLLKKYFISALRIVNPKVENSDQNDVVDSPNGGLDK
jgi:hypothetical protein